MTFPKASAGFAILILAVTLKSLVPGLVRASLMTSRCCGSKVALLFPRTTCGNEWTAPLLVIEVPIVPFMWFGPESTRTVALAASFMFHSATTVDA